MKRERIDMFTQGVRLWTGYSYTMHGGEEILAPDDTLRYLTTWEGDY